MIHGGSWVGGDKEEMNGVKDYILENHPSLGIVNMNFIGVSAGAHLSLLWSYANDTNNQVAMVCSIVGPVNFTDPAYYNSTNPVYQSIYLLFGNPSIAFLESASPYHRATVTSPPTLLFYGGQDPLVPSSQGIDMDSKLSSLGVPHEFTFYQDEGHGWYGQNLEDTFTKISNYINQYL